MAEVEVVIIDAALRYFLRGATGPVGRDLVKRGLRVQEAAKALCPVSDRDHGVHLRDTIAAERLPRQGVTGIELDVRATAPYAVYVHEGTAPHLIEARNRQALHWSTAGTDFFAAYVQHPGTHGQPFLRHALGAAL